MNYKRILVVAITRMGDLLQASPTIVGLKAHHPNAHVTILVDTQFAKICEGIPGIDEIIKIDMNYLASGIWNGGESLVSSYEYVSNLIDQLREQQFDFCLNMSNSTYTAILIKMLNIRETTGWLADEKGYRLMADKWAMLFTACIYHSNRNFNNINLVDFFRCAARVTKHPHSLVYNTQQDSEDRIHAFIERSFGSISDGPLICIQVGASQEKRQWSPRKFALLAKYLIEDLNARIVYTGAPAETAIVEEALSHFQHPQIVSSVGSTTIPDLAALLKKADLLITGDTGPMHLSVAVGTNVVALFLASALCFETGPYSKGNIVIQPQISCNPCNPNYPCARPDCHDQISPELVAYLTKLRLETNEYQAPFMQIPNDIAPETQVKVYFSDFDIDGFLEFYQINSAYSEESVHDTVARKTYRRLWKEELAKDLIQETQNNTDIETKFSSESDFSSAALSLTELASEACKQLELLCKVALDPTSPTQILSEISAQLTYIEKKIEEVSLTFPILGTIVRIFIIDKENIRGEDIIELSETTAGLYKDLMRRLHNFTKYYSYYEREVQARKEISYDPY